jgi:NADH-quinone oxidoreductase subunit G
MIELEIDGKTLEAAPGETIIQVADRAGIYIPRFCYHKKLSIAASCRMCLVEVEKAPKTLPACATPVMAGMKVNTRSEKALFSQKTVMEFLLINHPLDCPICDQGGECELQDLSLGYGKGISRFTEGKRAVHDEDLGPLIATEMTRCIQCTRCVRFGDEVAGVRELGAMGRGEDLEIATYVEEAVSSELSGNMIDVCPVGALTSKPYRFSARAWELRQDESLAPHDCLGSNIYVHTRGEEYTDTRHIMRVVPRENEDINETWLSDRDRFSYEAINSPERVVKPLIKKAGEWTAVTWQTALTEVASRLKKIVPEQIGTLVSSSATTEECYLLQKLMRGLGCYNIDYRLRQNDFREPAHPPFELSISDLEKLNTVLLIGSNIRFEQPLAGGRIRKAVKQGANVICINPVDYNLHFKIAQKAIVGAADFVGTLTKILQALATRLDKALPAGLPAAAPSAAEVKIAEQLLTGERKAILLGAYATQHADATIIQQLGRCIAELTGAHLGVFTEGANSQGAHLAGVIPAEKGLNAKTMFEKSLPAYVLWGVEPELDSAYPALAVKALEQAEFVVACSAFCTEKMSEYADVILPIATFAETAGTYVNVEGKWQSMQAVALPAEEVKTGWEVICELAKQCGLIGFDEVVIEELAEEIKTVISGRKLGQKAQQTNEHYQAMLGFQPNLRRDSKALYRIGQWPIYRVDSLVRHAKALQATMNENIAAIRINTQLAERLNLTIGSQVTAKQGDSNVTLPLVIDDTIADNQVWISAGLEATAGFGEIAGEIELKGIE